MIALPYGLPRSSPSHAECISSKEDRTAQRPSSISSVFFSSAPVMYRPTAWCGWSHHQRLCSTANPHSCLVKALRPKSSGTGRPDNKAWRDVNRDRKLYLGAKFTFVVDLMS